MAMTILNNTAAMMTLGELNKNINKVGKSLAKVSTGQRIIGASDDSASFAISEKMREQIRSLEQDIQNVQNGTSLLRTAHGGIENIVEELRSLKELAIDSANDSNTDEDRAIIQKEFDQRRATIDEIATWTNYNGKPLLDGRYKIEEKMVTVPVHGIVGGGNPPNTIDIVFAVDTTGSMSSYISQVAMNLKNFANHLYDKGFDFRFGLVKFDDINEEEGKTFGVEKENFKTGEFTKDTDEFETILRGLRATGGGDGPESGYESIMDEENGVMSFNFREEATKRVIILTDADVHDPGETKHPGEYSAEDLVSSLQDKGIVAYAVTELYGEAYNDWSKITNGTGGKIYDIDSDYGAALDDFVNSAPAPQYPIQYERSIVAKGDPLVIHHGTKANQRINFYINDMNTNALRGIIPSEKDRADLAAYANNHDKLSELSDILGKAYGKSIAEASVKTKDDAKVAIRIVDGAIDYALDEATRVGAYLQRLDYTEENVTAQDENTQGAESTIRDADMAKEMTEYTKNNVLSQAAQAMLAQANQNLSGVLSLLQ